MTGRGKGSPLPVVGLVAIAAAALLFLGGVDPGWTGKRLGQ